MRLLATLLIGGFLLGGIPVEAQILKQLGNKIERKVRQRIDRKTDQAIDRGLDEVEDAASGKKDPAKEEEQQTPVAESSKTGSEGKSVADPFRVNTDFDFIPGERTLFAEDFSGDNVGDFPARWNTNGSGEVVTLNGQEGRWLKIPDNTLSFPEVGKALPENFTVEFDLFYPATSTRPPISFGFSEVPNPAKQPIASKKLFYFLFANKLQNVGYSTSDYSGRETNKTWPTTERAGKPIRVSLSVNKQRIRLYLNQDKLFDLPKAFDVYALRNNLYFRSKPIIPAPEDGFYIANLRIAETGEDLRSKLLREGKVSTTAILFDVGSANIKQQSYGVIREIAKIMQANQEMRINIVGHTDSDGEEGLNLELSKKRADAVKEALSTHFAISASRLETAGKGESEPLASNTTKEGKGQNRRVEFIKL